MYLEASAPAQPGNSATLVSSKLTLRQGCDAEISFYFSMFGQVGRLYVQVGFIIWLSHEAEHLCIGVLTRFVDCRHWDNIF